MNRFSPCTVLIAAMTWHATAAAASEPFIYPAQGQSEAQQKTDKAECNGWATNETGIDPTALAQQTVESQADIAASASTTHSAPPPHHRGGALRGAAAGAVIGEIADDDAGQGAAYGAAAGVLHQRRKNVRGHQAAAEAQATEQAMANEQIIALSEEHEQSIATWTRAYTACLEGRGYTVN